MLDYIKAIWSLPFSAKWFLLTECPYGFAIGIWNMCMNFHLKEFGLREGDIGTMLAFGMCVIAVFSVVAGYLGDRVGFRQVMVTGCFLIGLGFIIMGFGRNIPAFYLAQFLYGVGISFIMAIEFPYLIGMVGNDQKQMVYSLLMCFYFVAMVFANLLSGAFSSWMHNLRDPYLYEIVFGGVLFILMAIARTRLPQHETEAHYRIDFLSTIRDKKILSYLLFGCLTLVFYNALLSMLNIIFRNRYQLPDNVIGVMFSLTSIAGGVTAFVAPLIARKWKQKKAAIITMTVQAIVIACMAFANTGFFMILLMMRFVTVNLVYTVVDMPMLQSVERKQQGSYSGLRICSNYIGMSIGSALAGAFLAGSHFAPLMLTASAFAFMQLIVYTFWCRRYITMD